MAGGRVSVSDEEMLQLRRTGLTDKEIAAKLGISPQTVARHIGSRPAEEIKAEKLANVKKAQEARKAKKKLAEMPPETPETVEEPVVDEQTKGSVEAVVEPPRPIKKEKSGEMIETNLLRFAYIPAWCEQLHILKEMAQPEPWRFRDFDWDANNPETPILAYHINRVFQKAAVLRNSLSEEEANRVFFIKGDTACFNTGLQTPLYQDIYAVFGRNKRPGAQPWYFLEFATDTLVCMRHVHPLPVPFQSACPSLGAFHPERDIRVSVRHITTNPKNRERVPASIRDAWNLPLLIQASVDMSRRKAIVEPDIVVRAINLSRGTGESSQTYLLPLWLTRPEAPDLVLVLIEENGYYLGATALTPHMAYGNARLFGRPTAKWLTDLLE